MIKKKVIFSSFDDLGNPYYSGGGAVAVHEIARRMVSTFDIEVITGNYPGAKNRTIDGVRYSRIGNANLNPKLAQLYYSFLLPRLIKRSIFDVWVESFTPPFSVALLPLCTKKPVIGLVHMLSGLDMWRKYHLPFHWFETIGLKAYASAIVLSTITQQTLLHVNPNMKIAIIPNAVEIIPNYSPAKKKKHILFLGRIELNQKGLDLLLEAYSRSYKQLNYPLIIAGSGSSGEEHNLKAMIDSLRLKSHVMFVGRADQKMKKRLFEESLLLVLPSRFETCSMVALEAMRHSIPLLTFDIEGLEWIPKDCRYVTRTLNADSLAKSMISITSNLKRQHEQIKNGLVLTRDLSWDSAAAQYAQFIGSYV
jgi:glycosyltransferase involved in cell wall biosynthesis